MRRFWVRAGLIVIILGILSGLWANVLWRQAQTLERDVSYLVTTLEPQALLSDSSSLKIVGRELEIAHEELDSIAMKAKPFTFLGAGLGWLPWIGSDLRYSGDLLERASADLESASETAYAVAEVLRDYRDFDALTLDTPDARVAGELLVGEVEQVEARLRTERDLYLSQEDEGGENTRFTSGYWGNLIDREEQLAASSSLAEHAAGSIATLMNLQLVLAEREETFPDLDAVNDLVADIRGHVRSMRSSVQVAVSHPSPELTASLDALGALTDGIFLATDSLLEILEAFESEGTSLLHNGPGLEQALKTSRENAERLAEASLLLQEGMRLLEGQGAGGEDILFIGGLFDQVQDAASQLETATRFVYDVTLVADELLGFDEPRTYLVLAHSVDELRATGGYVNASWLMTFSEGELADVTFYDIVEVDDWDRLQDYPSPPAALEEHMNASVWLLRDVSWNPHFPDTAQMAIDMFEIGQRRHVDGVVGINAWMFKGLIDVLGSIPSPEGDVSITAETLFPFLEQSRDNFADSYLDLVLQSFLTRLNQSANRRDMVGLASVLQEQLNESNLTVYVQDPDAQDVLRNLGWSGEVRQSEGDYLLVIDSNVGWNKVDRNIERNLSYIVNLNTEGLSQASLTVSYRNLSGDGATGCEPQWLTLSPDATYASLKEACYWNYLRVFLPQETRLLDADPLPLEEGSIAAASGWRLPGEDTIELWTAYEKTVIGGLLMVPAREQREATVLYELPESLLERQADGTLLYRLLIQHQPGVDSRSVDVEIHAPQGYEIQRSSLSPIVSAPNAVFFQFDLEEDIELEIVLSRS